MTADPPSTLGPHDPPAMGSDMCDDSLRVAYRVAAVRRNGGCHLRPTIAVLRMIRMRNILYQSMFPPMDATPRQYE